ncbi:hypothetical protein Tco_0897255 [Tanacetum coccineum]
MRRSLKVLSIWKASGGNTRGLGSFGEETDKTTNLNQHLSRIFTQKLETASQITHDVVTTHLKTASQDLQTASDCLRKTAFVWNISVDMLAILYKTTIDQSAGGKLRDLNAEESWALLEDLTLYDNDELIEPRDFAKKFKDDGEVMFIEIIQDDDEPQNEGPNEGEGATTKGPAIEQYNSLSNLEKEHTKSVYLRNEEDKRRGVEYVMSKILGFYKECLELGPEYLTGMDDEGEVT